ncbi:MAG TPA: FixH family protein [Candidatus Baltobacteraceae bacterium]|nr:FixH family protein [Candidatus Baltobacteraceae bacterium]
MKPLLAVTVLLALAACGGKATSSQLSVTAAFSPNPPKQGSEAIIVSLKDADGKPVTGATVRIVTTMPAMSMTGPNAIAKDNGDGTYTANLVLQYATSWTFDVDAAVGGKSMTAEINQDVK